MPNAQWPGELPDAQFLGLTDEESDAALRFETDSGIPTVRPRYSAVLRNVDIPVLWSGAARKRFKTFFGSELTRGVLRFDWEDPLTDTVVTMRFRKPVKWVLDTGGSTDGRQWRGVLQLEILP